MGSDFLGHPVYIYIYIYIFENTGCCPEDLPDAMNDKEKWREWVKDIRTSDMT